MGKVQQIRREKGEGVFLIVDQGSHGTRAGVMDGRGLPLAWARRPLGVRKGGHGRVEHDPGELILTVVQTVEEVLGTIDPEAVKLHAAGFATQRSSIVCWDRTSGQALSPVISWQDTRARDRIGALSGTAEQIHSRTGLFLSPHYGASKLAWCLEHLSPVRRAHEEDRLCFGPLSSFITWHLARGNPFVTDPVSASRTLLYSMHERDWDPYLLRVFGVPPSCLPACVPTVYEFGTLEAGKHAVPLRLVTGDQSAALYAFGELRRDTAYVNVGTGAFVARAVGKEPVMAQRLLTSVLKEQQGEGDYVLEGTVNGAGSALKWAQAALDIRNLEGQLPAWLNKGESPPLFLNGVSGLGSPYWVADFESGFLGSGSQGDMAVAVVESIVFLLYRNMVEMERHLPRPARIQITGGLSSLDGVCQRLSDLSRIPVYRPGELEATARGTCYLLAGSPDSWPEPSPGRLFDPGDAVTMPSRYKRWLEAMEKRLAG